MKVELIARPSFVGEDTDEGLRCRDDQLTGTDGEKVAEFAGRVCYESWGKGRDSDAFAANILDHFHPNVLYHSVFVMSISGISRNLSHELVRHHVGFSPSQRSTRYVDERNTRVIDHPVIGADRSLMSDAWDEDYGRFAESFRALYARTVDELIAQGHDRKTARGAAARYLPNGIETRLVWSGNAAAFLSMIPRRSTPKVVDEEFRLLAKAMLDILKEEMPRYFAHLEVP